MSGYNDPAGRPLQECNVGGEYPYPYDYQGQPVEPVVNPGMNDQPIFDLSMANIPIFDGPSTSTGLTYTTLEASHQRGGRQELVRTRLRLAPLPQPLQDYATYQQHEQQVQYQREFQRPQNHEIYQPLYRMPHQPLHQEPQQPQYQEFQQQQQQPYQELRQAHYPELQRPQYELPLQPQYSEPVYQQPQQVQWLQQYQPPQQGLQPRQLPTPQQNQLAQQLHGLPQLPPPQQHPQPQQLQQDQQLQQSYLQSQYQWLQPSLPAPHLFKQSFPFAPPTQPPSRPRRRAKPYRSRHRANASKAATDHRRGVRSDGLSSDSIYNYSINATLGVSSKPFTYCEGLLWAIIRYHELGTQLGESFYAKLPTTIVDGYTLPKCSDRFCLGAIPNNNRKPYPDWIRARLGRGLLLFYSNGDLYMKGLAPYSMFVSDPLRSRVEDGVLVEHVSKLTPGLMCKVFSIELFTRLLSSAYVHGWEAVFEMSSRCSVKASFVKGWGRAYRRKVITDCEVWIELLLVGPLQWIDNALKHSRRATDINCHSNT